MTDLHRAIDRLRSARGRIVAVAADWQTRGIDTAPLTPALVDLQDALAHVEGLAQLAEPVPAHVADRESATPVPERIQPLLLPDEPVPA